MSRPGVVATIVLRVLILIAGAAFVASCGASSPTVNIIPLPVVTVSPASASVAVGQQLQFSASVVTSVNTTITWSVNNIAGGSSTVGTINSSGLYAAPAHLPSPAAVMVRATSSAETDPYGAAIVTITNPPANPLSLFPADSSTPAETTVPFVVSSSGAGSFSLSVNGVAGGNSSLGSISSQQVYTAPTAAPNPATVAITATNTANAGETASTTLTVTAGNSAPLFVNFGINGNTGNPNTAYYNGLFTSVTVCLPGTTVCQIIPDILVDTGSTGLRVLNSALTIVPATELQTIKDSAGNQVQECVQFGDTSYAWGPLYAADVGIASEAASAVPIQVIGGSSFPVPAANCLTLGPGPSLDTVQALGANGILGVGNYVRDCGANCAVGQTFSGYPYYVCPKNVCQTTSLTVEKQVANPVALFPKDNNGVGIVLPAINSGGAPNVPFVNADGSGLIPAGLLVFGVGTQSNNALGNATVYGLDGNGNFPAIGFNNATYNSDGFLDTGSNALYVSDAQTLGILNCADNPYYCPASSLPLSLNLQGANGSSGTVTLSIASADVLFDTNPGFAAFNNLGGPSGAGMSTDYFDLGLPFFFGRSVWVGIAGQAVPNNVSAPDGYYAF